VPGSQRHVICSGLGVNVSCKSYVFLASLFATSHNHRTVKIRVQCGYEFVSYSHTIPPKMASKKKKTSKAHKMQTPQALITKTDADTSQSPSLLPAEPRALSNGLPGVVVDEASGPCTFQLKGGKPCTCQKYSEDVPRDPRSPGCRECTHGHSVHNGRRPSSDDVHGMVRDVLINSKLGNGAIRGNLAPLKAAQHESKLGYRPKDKVRNTHRIGKWI
jgi:hypothetical protein